MTAYIVQSAPTWLPPQRVAERLEVPVRAVRCAALSRNDNCHLPAGFRQMGIRNQRDRRRSGYRYAHAGADFKTFVDAGSGSLGDG